MFTNKINPKALNLDGLDISSKKVTIGFKCNPQVKLKLANEATKLGLTLSEFVENLILNLENVNHETREIKNLRGQIAFYENDSLKKLFDKYAGQKVAFKNNKGKDLKIEIKDIKDVYTVVIDSFK